MVVGVVEVAVQRMIETYDFAVECLLWSETQAVVEDVAIFEAETERSACKGELDL